MKREVLDGLIKAILTLRDTADDAVALASVYAFPEWKPNTEYTVGSRRRRGDKLYRCLQSHTSQEGWEPDKTPALWMEISVEEWPEWIQPHGSEDAYHLDAKVSHNGEHWISDVDNNVWEPGVYGWRKGGN